MLPLANSPFLSLVLSPLKPLLKPLKSWSKMAIALGLALVLWLIPSPAHASIHTYPLESNGNSGAMVRSLQTLRDNRDRGWQVVLFFNVIQNQVADVHVRLAGFPGTVIQRSAPLRVTQSSTQWDLPDVFDITGKVVSEVGNIGEYDAGEMMRSLDRSRPMLLTVPLAAGDVEITLPPFAVKEWLKLREQATAPKV